ncbi:MAG: universal stress protein [Ardenticatenaceae bacterium]|nr:universal stress protein [Ardenticatenaceae bacterium]
MNQKPATIQRIAVALDTSPHSRAALLAAVKVAAQLQAQLIGIFVEDLNLLRLAQLPFAHEVRYASPTPQKLDTGQLEMQLHSQANHAREELRQIAETHNLAWSFQVLRGMVAAELLAAAQDADLLVLGRTGRPAPRNWLGSTARTAVHQRQRPTLLIQPHFHLDQIVLVYDGTAAAQRALQIAGDLARGNGRLTILLFTPDRALAQQWQHDIHTQLADTDLAADFHLAQDTAELTAVLTKLDVGLLITSQQETVQNLLQVGERPLLIVH